MLKGLRTAFLLLVGVGFVLLSLWAKDSEQGGLLVAIWGAAVVYVGFLAANLPRFKEIDWIKALVGWLWAHALKTTPRAAVLCVLAIIADAGALKLWLNAQPSATVAASFTISRPSVQPSVTLAALNAPFAIEVSGSGVSGKIQKTQTDEHVDLTLPRVDPNAELHIAVNHPAFEPIEETRKFGDLTSGAVINVHYRPAIVVTTSQPTPMTADAEFSGTTQRQSREFSKDAAGVFTVGYDERWRVTVTDSKNKRKQASPILRVLRPATPAVAGDFEEFAVQDAADAWVKLTEEIAPSVVRALAPPRIDHGEAVPAGFGEHLLGAPPSSANLQVRSHFVFDYDNELKIARWAAYQLAPLPDRRGERLPFTPDPQLPAGARAELEDYRGSGYDRGHLVSPADISRYGDEAVRDANRLSVVAPQDHGLNIHTWLRIEQATRQHAEKTKKPLFVIAGPAMISGRGEAAEYATIGRNEVAVPTHFWRVVAKDGERIEVQCFLIPNRPVKEEPMAFAATIGEIERATGLKFFRGIEAGRAPDRQARATEMWD